MPEDAFAPYIQEGTRRFRSCESKGRMRRRARRVRQQKIGQRIKVHRASLEPEVVGNGGRQRNGQRVGRQGHGAEQVAQSRRFAADAVCGKDILSDDGPAEPLVALPALSVEQCSCPAQAAGDTQKNPAAVECGPVFCQKGGCGQIIHDP